MSRRYTNKAGIELQTLCVEVPVEFYREIRIAAAEQNTNMSKFIRALLEGFFASRSEMQQLVVNEFSELVATEIPEEIPG
jgi:hypothetical protein